MGVAALNNWRDFNFTRLRNDPILNCPEGSFLYEDPSLFYDTQMGVSWGWGQRRSLILTQSLRKAPTT